MKRMTFLIFLIFVVKCSILDSNEELRVESTETTKEKELFIKAILGEISYDSLRKIPVDNGYIPNQPINFSHAIHAVKLNITCRECHNRKKELKLQVGFDSCAKCHGEANEYLKPEMIDSNYYELMFDLNLKIKELDE